MASRTIDMFAPRCGGPQVQSAFTAVDLEASAQENRPAPPLPTAASSPSTVSSTLSEAFEGCGRTGILVFSGVAILTLLLVIGDGIVG